MSNIFRTIFALRFRGSTFLFNIFLKYFSKSKKIKLIDNYDGDKYFVCDLSSHMASQIYWRGSYSYDIIKFIDRNFKAIDTFVDIGTNIGEFSIFMASRANKVISFEPVTEIRNILLSNVYINKFNNIKVNAFGLSNQNAKLPIYTSASTDSEGKFNEGLGSFYKSSERNLEIETVDVKVFDELFPASKENIELIKIDIEGSELFALKGLIENIKRSQPIVIVEINKPSCSAAGYETSEIIDLFTSLSYSAYIIKRHGRLEPLQRITDFQNVVFTPEKTTNKLKN